MKTRDEFIEELDRLPINSEIMLGVIKVSKGLWRVEGGGIIMYTGNGGVWDLFQAIREVAKERIEYDGLDKDQ